MHPKDDERAIWTGTLHPDGSVSDEKQLAVSDIKKCPHFIIAPEHYREDGSCRCNDPDHSLMAEWEYRWNFETRRWE